MRLFSWGQPDYVERLGLAENRLMVASTLARFASKAYSRGKLQRATDARSKAETCVKVAHGLIASEIDEPGASAVKSMLREVQAALARLPASYHKGPRFHATCPCVEMICLSTRGIFSPAVRRKRSEPRRDL